MTDRERTTYIKRINTAREQKVYVPEDLISDDKIRGIYGFFKTQDGKEECFYVGKSNDIRSRIIGGSGHITLFLRGVQDVEVPREIAKLLTNGNEITLRVLKLVPYDFSKSFAYNANTLCLEELRALVEEQALGHCVDQLSEAVKINYDRDDWDKAFKEWSNVRSQGINL